MRRMRWMIILIFVLILAMTLGLAGCGGSSSSQETEKLKKDIEDLKKQTEDEKLAKLKEDLTNQQATLSKEKEKLENQKKIASSRLPKPADGNTWFVVLGSYPKSQSANANSRLSSVKGMGWDVHLVNTDEFPGFKSGLISVVSGPFSKAAADSLLDDMRSSVSDAYVKSGW